MSSYGVTICRKLKTSSSCCRIFIRSKINRISRISGYQRVDHPRLLHPLPRTSAASESSRYNARMHESKLHAGMARCTRSFHVRIYCVSVSVELKEFLLTRQLPLKNQIAVLKRVTRLPRPRIFSDPSSPRARSEL